MSLFGTRLGSLLSISVVLPVNIGCYPGYSGRFYYLGVSSSPLTLHVFLWYKTWIFTQYIRDLTCQHWMLPWTQSEILFPWSFFKPRHTSCLCLVQDLDLYSVYQWSYLSPGYSGRFYFLGVSSIPVTLHVFVWYKTWIFTQYISGLTCQQWMLPWIQ